MSYHEEHRHLITLHRHPDWPCHPRPGRWHWHFWWRHTHELSEIHDRRPEMTDTTTPMATADCPQAAQHGNPFRYCPVKGCGWREDMPAPEPAPGALLRLQRDVYETSRSDWYFYRQADGAVQISKNRVTGNLTQQAASIMLTPDEWDQVVAAVSR